MWAVLTTRQSARRQCLPNSGGCEDLRHNAGAAMTAPQRHDHAVAFCCDARFLPFALFMIWQIAHLNPHRRFDFVISTQDDLVLPDWTAPYGIVLHKTGGVDVTVDLRRFEGSLATMFRLALARELGDRYRRILYLDCDMFVEGGDISQLLEVDLGPHPVGAVLDAPHFYVADYHAEEFVRAGLPAAPYFNSGLLLIDTQAFRDQDVESRARKAATTRKHAIVHADQSLMNFALQGKFAQLAPCWNWQANDRLQLLPLRYPVFFNHFSGSKKPDRESTGLHGARYNAAYRAFFAAFMPEVLDRIAPPCDPAPIVAKRAVGLVVRHIMAARLVGEIIARHPDPYRARL
jgi:hypothetical protein